MEAMQPVSSYRPALITAQNPLSLFEEKKPVRQLKTTDNSYAYKKLSSDYHAFNFATVHELHTMQQVASMYDLVLAQG